MNMNNLIVGHFNDLLCKALREVSISLIETQHTPIFFFFYLCDDRAKFAIFLFLPPPRTLADLAVVRRRVRHEPST